MAKQAESFKGTQRRKIIYSRLGEDVEVWATVVWLQIGGLVSVTAHFQDMCGGAQLALAHSRVGGLIYNSITGQAVRCSVVMGDEYEEREVKGDVPIWVEGTSRVCLKALAHQMGAMFMDKPDEEVHPWIRTSEFTNP